jgi:type VI secretion system secreted protein Hcp
MSIYLKFEGIEGEATATGFEKQIAIDSVQFGVGRAVSALTGSGTKREASQASVSEITVTKTFDASSTKLLKAATVDREGKKVTITFVTVGTTPQTYLTYDLSDTIVSGYHISSGGERPVESISLNFTEFKASYTPTSEDNKAGAPARFGYDLATAKSI